MFLRQSIVIAMSSLIGLLDWRRCRADWTSANFATAPFNDIFMGLFGKQIVAESSLISLSLPKTAENGAVVPITISSELEGIDRFYILIEKNPTPLAAEFELSGAALPYVAARIKMAESCNVIVIARQSDRLYKAQQWVNVMQGGCGTG